MNAHLEAIGVGAKDSADSLGEFTREPVIHLFWALFCLSARAGNAKQPHLEASYVSNVAARLSELRCERKLPTPAMIKPKLGDKKCTFSQNFPALKAPVSTYLVASGHETEDGSYVSRILAFEDVFMDSQDIIAKPWNLANVRCFGGRWRQIQRASVDSLFDEDAKVTVRRSDHVLNASSLRGIRYQKIQEDGNTHGALLRVMRSQPEAATEETLCRQSVFQRVNSPLRGRNNNTEDLGRQPLTPGLAVFRTRQEVRSLLRKVIQEQVLLTRMEKETRLQASQDESSSKRLRLDHGEVEDGPCDAEMAEGWD
ncbi:hypothetical protein MRX96_017820 [Rhipicephalus microplus]